MIWWPFTAIVTSMSTTSPGFAYDRYCAVAQTHWRPDVPSIAEIAAPRPEPPNRKFPVVEMPSVTGNFQRNGLWVGSRPRNVRESMAKPIVGGTYSPIP